MNKVTLIVGRILLSLPLLVFGLGHFANAQQMAGMVPSYVPGATFWIYLTGAALLAAAASFISGIQTRKAGYGAALLLATIALTVQLPGMTKVVDPADAVAGAYKMMAFAGFFKDLALAGGSLVLASTSKG
jgi:uncharacterized membrane protein YphA (DoxX/SURF4 family)